MSNSLSEKMIVYGVERPKQVVWLLIIATIISIMMALVPSLWPDKFQFMHPLLVDTDPENMLAADEPVRQLHREAKQRFDLKDIVVVGVVNDQHPQGVFNAESLKRVYDLTEYAKTLSWAQDDGSQMGVIGQDIIAPSTVDNIEQSGLGSVNFSWLMPQPPATDAEALQVKTRAQNMPFLNGTMISENGKALAIYLPISDKKASYQIRQALLAFTADWQNSGDTLHITGLPVAEDTFGVEMFIQMAISAPLAMLVIFILLWLFFKKLVLIASPMIIAMVCSLVTMAWLIISGHTIHIMSSMIPIFIMPIAVLDAVHILSEFFDCYPKYRDRKAAIVHVVRTLYTPMLYTTLTTVAAFASLMLTPIPPVQVFGGFVAIGVFLAWLCTIVFIPAYIMLIDEKSLAGYGMVSDGKQTNWLTTLLSKTGTTTLNYPKLILALSAAITVLAAFGISKIVVNDNPMRWFEPHHPIRNSDRILNKHFGGTYMAYLEFAAPQSPTVNAEALAQRLDTFHDENPHLDAEIVRQFRAQIVDQNDTLAIPLFAQLQTMGEQASDLADDDQYATWQDLLLFIDQQAQNLHTFKQPEVLEWLASLQTHLLRHDHVGKVNALPDLVKTVYRELQLGKPENFRIPDSANAVAQTLITLQSGHRPNDLWHFVTPDFRRTTLWLQLSSGDNRDMIAVQELVERYIADQPPPRELASNWFGLTYINVVWQEKMVTGMLEAFLGSFVVVLLMMVLLFRSLLLGLLAMIPLTITVGLIYGVIGLIGKDYDMPVAVLSALSLGLAIDYAIHLLARSRQAMAQHGDWPTAVKEVFGEPARAISRNAIILAAGFLPLLAAPLVPYQTVGVFIAAIIFSAGIASLLILPAFIALFTRRIFNH